MNVQTTEPGTHRQLIVFISTSNFKSPVYVINICCNFVPRPICGVCLASGVMTSYGCQPCPPEEIIAPIRNVALAIGIAAISVLWFWYSWSPLFPSVGHCISRIEFCLCQKAEEKSKLAEFLATCMEAVEKLRLAQYSKIFISYFQVMSSFVGLNVPWPPVILSCMVWCKTVFNVCFLSMPGVSCFWKGLEYNSKLVAYTVIPLCLGFMLFLPLLVVSILESLQRNAEEQKLFLRTSTVIKDRSWNAILLVCFLVSIVLTDYSSFIFSENSKNGLIIRLAQGLNMDLGQLYPQLSSVALEPFNCQPEGLGLLAAGFVMNNIVTDLRFPSNFDLWLDVRMSCPSAVSFTRIWAVACIFVFSVGIPVFSILVMMHMGIDRLAKEKVFVKLVCIIQETKLVDY
jgi:hypothetical protein